MSVTLAEMHVEVKQAHVGRGDVETLIDASLNQAQLLMATRLRIHELEVVATAVASPLGATPGILAQPSDFWAPVIMVNKSKQRMEIKWRPLDLVLTDPGTSAGTPSRVSVRGATFVFSPIFKDADVVELTYRFKPQAMTAVINMTLPDEFKPVVVFHSIAHIAFLVQEEDRAKLFLDQRDNNLKMIGDQRGEEFVAQVEGMRVQWNSMEGITPSYGGRSWR